MINLWIELGIANLYFLKVDFVAPKLAANYLQVDIIKHVYN